MVGCGFQGLGAMVATISRNLAELRQENLETSSTSSVISLFRNSSLPRRVVEKEPVIQVFSRIYFFTFSHEVMYSVA